jgi:hypothetical protein
VTEPGDEIDSWLSHEVEPLAPAPGTFERIHRKARQRKRRQALGAAAAGVVVIAGAVLVPTLGLRPGGQQQALSSPGVTHTVTVTPSPSPTAPRHAASSPPAAAPSAGTATGTALGDASPLADPPPAGFQPTSITMIGLNTGAVIGQAGTAGRCAPPVPADCTSLAGTSNYGKSWYGVSAPVTGVPRGSTGTSQLRFLNTQFGWAYGPQLFSTSNGGRTWGAVPTGGERVTDLEAAGDRAFVVRARCQGGGTAYAADCSRFSLSYLVTGTSTLRAIPLTTPAGVSAATALGTAGRAGAASLVIRGVAGDPSAGTGYLLAPSGDIFSGSVGGGAWSYAGQAPCSAGAASASGSPLGAQLTVSGGMLLLNCAAGSSGAGGSAAAGGQPAAQAKQLYQSADGAHWTKVSQPPSAGMARSLAATAAGQVVLASTAGIDYSANGTTWQAASISDAPPGGFSYVGMTSDSQGVALPAQASLGEVFITTDGGRSWSASPIAG